MYFLDLLQKHQLKAFLLLIGTFCAITTLAQDYSDAPTGYGSPSHSIVSSLYIGNTAPDNDGAALPTTNANGDNVRNINDENTFTSFPALTVSNTTYTLSSIPVFNNTGSTATLTAWIDFNRNGVFDATEGIQSAAIASSSSATTTSLTWTNIGTSPDISPGKSFIRFRLTTNGGVTTSTPSTATTDGEVEDYVLTIGTVANSNCASTGTSSTTLNFQNPTLESGTALAVGAVYRFPQVTTGVDALVRINALVNTTITNIDNTTVVSGPVGEASALQPSLSFSTNPVPTDPYAEFQVSFVAEGTTTSYVQFTSVNATAIDIDGDGSSTLREYQEFPNLPSYILNGSTNILVSNNGNFKRFYPNSNANQPGISTSTVTNAATGVFNNISTFTYRAGATLLDANSSRAYPRYYSLFFQCVSYSSPATTVVNNRDYGDAPNTYGTLAASSGASHIYTDNLKLGVEGADTEPDGFSDGTQSSALAQDDDQKGTISGGDEASVDFIRTLYTNSTSYSIAVTASNNTGSSANLRAWLDFNRNGTFDVGEVSALTTVPTGVTNQQYVVSWSGLSGLSAGQSFLRVRLTTGTLNTNEATGAKNDGEVEDYAVTINTGNPPVSIAGTVYDDVNGINNSALDGTGTNTGGTLYALLVNSASNLVASSAVQADGSYIFNAITAGTYTVRLSTSAGTVGNAAPAVSLPSGWVSTSEAVAPAFNDGTVDGILSITVGTTDFSGANFGIDHLPTPGSGTATVTNTGGTNPVTVPPSAFTSVSAASDASDTPPGSVTAIRITAFPSNTTSLTINGTAYTSLPAGGITVPTNVSGAPTVSILVDPTNDSNPVSFSFVAIDNASKESTAIGTAVINSSLVLVVSGSVWNDADGNLALNGSEAGTNAGGPLYVNLVSATNTVLTSTTVSAAGSYSLTGVPASTSGLKLVLSTSASATTPGPLPNGWVNTGESVGTTNSATQSTTLGQIELSTGTTAITAQNFGIEQLPTPGSGSATVVNTGGTSGVSVPPSAFTSTAASTDTAPGSVTAIRISAFPTNTTSLTINGSVYTSLPTGGIVVATTSAGAPTVGIFVDPTNDSNPVVFSFVAIDNAGKESTTTGTATINSSLVLTVSGNVWNDADGNLSLNSTEAGTNAGGPLYVNLVSASNVVVATASVNANGTYTLSGVPASTTGLRLVLTSTASSTAVGPLPGGWVNTGESVGTGNPATQSSVLGQIELSTGTVAIIGQNFGIEQLPTPGSGSAIVVNTGGTSGVSVPPSAFTSTTASTDTAPGSVTAIRISAFPTNTTSLTINGSVYTSLPAGGIVVATDGNGAPTVGILVDPTNDSNPVVFSFVAVDNAGKESTTTGTATLNSSLVLTVSGSVWNDADGNLALYSPETGTNAGGPLYVNLVSATNTVLTSTTVSAAGSYSLTGVPASTSGLKLVLSTSASATTPGPLPNGWVNTGESVGTTNSATQSTTLGQIELSTGTTAITAQNFGIEQLPTPGSGSATVVNTGGTSGVSVPPSAFTSTAASTDTAPGSVTAIRISAFPTNTTSLTINGSVYTSLPAGGIVVATTSAGAPTVGIFVDPTNDSNPVVFSFVAIDNAGKESVTTGTATLNSTLVIALSGTVWNDADGNLALNGAEAGTNAGGPLYVNLVSATNAVIASTTVAATGVYSLTGLPTNTSGLRLVLTNTASSTAVGPLPNGWVNTGEVAGTNNSATQSSVLGQIELSTGTTAVSGADFGIEQLPSAGSGSATVVNTGGTSGVSVPPSAFTSTVASADTAPGSVTAIRISTFPTNTTSLTVNGTTYTSLPAGGIIVATTSAGAPTVAVLVDPTNDSSPVVFTFVAIDNAGKESATTGTATINSSLVLTVSGNVWNDADGNLSLNGTEAGTNAGGPLYVNLVNASGAVVTATSVNANGTYTLSGVPASSTGLRLVLTSTASSTAVGPLPGGWVNTGESVGTGNPATQSSVLGQIELSTGTVAIIAQNFGIEQLPTPGSGSATVVNTGGTAPVSVPASAFTSTVASTDTAPGSVTAIRISAFPTNTTSLTINGSVYTSLPAGGIVVATDGNGAPTVSILVDPANDSNPVVFSFVAIDNAGKESTTTGTATINSSLVLTVSGNVWNDADGNLALYSPETGTNAGGPLYVNLVDASSAVLASSSVTTDGSYSLTGVPASSTGLRLILTNSASSTAVGPLPGGWVNTGESVGTTNTATQSTTLGQIELSTGTVAIIAQNFGIEQLPTPGSGSATVVNTGGTAPVSVPASAFTSISASADTAPGSVTAIRISAFPSNTTSLTINGSVYTSLPTGGIVVATDGNGAPTGAILVDPTNDSNPVVFSFVAIDNAGKESTTTGTATISSSLVLTVSGNVWNDADGNLSLNGTEAGTNTGGPLYVNLVSASNVVVATASVNANGTYTVTGVPASSTGLTLILTNSASSTAVGPLPGGWVNTGESVGTGNPATQSSVLGQIELSTGTVAIIAQNFGIEQLPTPGSGSATVVNTGGTAPVSVPASAFTSISASADTAPGSVTAIRISAFPSNTTSLTINGSVYTSLPAGGIVVATDGNGAPTGAILVDPTNDSNPVVFTFVAIDNAGKESTTTGTATISSSLVLTVSGNVWNDADGNLALYSPETGTNAGGPLYVNLVDASSAVLASSSVTTDGSYSLTGVPASSTGLRLILTNSASSTVVGPLPSGWVNTGESVGTTNTATQSTTLGQIELSTGTTAITAQNFGIEQLPTPGSGSATIVNTGGTAPVSVPASAFTSTVASTDTAPGSVTALRISAFPTNTTSLTVNGSVYTSLPAGGIVVATDATGAPTGAILVDPANDSSPVVFTFVAIDNAGKESTTTGTATINSSLVLTVSGNVWNDADGDLALNGSETGTNAGGPLYVNLVDVSNAVLASSSVAPDGSYSLSGVPASSTGLRLILTSTSSSTAVGPLPGGWVNTGESVGTGNPATQSSVLGQIELSTGTTSTTAQNFGIEQLPSAGSGSAIVVNRGGSTPVNVPVSAFTSISTSTDTAPGSVTAIRISAFPTNTTSLTVNGTTYTSLPAGGIVVATDGNGAPTGAILVDPTNDSNPVVFSFVAVDNAGKESTTTGTATISSSLVLTVSGNVWNDADGNLSLNSTEAGTNAGGPLYINLVNASNVVIATASVNANGTYTLSGVPASSTGLRLILTSTSSSTAVGPLPGGWVNTGESVGTGNPATQSSVLGQIELSTGTVAIIAQNFGIEHLPTPGSGSATVVNTGGTSGVSVPLAAFTSISASTDTAPGSVTAIRISAFPSNTTSLTINGSVYTSLPAGGIVVATDGNGAPTVSILVDPTNDSNPVVFSFVAVDNAGKESATTGTATISSSLVLTVSGNVWNDADGNLALYSPETGTNAGGPLYVNLVDASSTVLASSSVATDGSYSLSGVPASSTGLRLVLTSTASSTAVGPLPGGWVNTGESVGTTNTATQSSVLGQIELSTGTVAITAQNFGIEQLPSAGSGSATVVNTGGSSGVSVPASAFTSISTSTDTAPGSVTAIRISAFPTNTTSLTVNGSVYTSLPAGGIVVATDGNGAPTVSILVDPTNDSNPVVFSFVAVDNAGKESATTGTATISSSLVLTVSGNVWNDADGDLALNGTEAGTNAGGPLYVNLVDVSNAVLASSSVAADGSYSLSGVPASSTGLRLVLTNSTSSTAVGPLPGGWVNTGESVGTGTTATQSSVLGQIELSTGTTSITAQNFGIEQLPTPGSGSAIVVNRGGSSGVSVPASAFTSTTPSADTAPGSVTAIRISAFPTNTTSLTVNGSVYTSLPAGGILLATDATGAPTGAILVDPTNDSSPVVFTFVAIDNAGKESMTTGTATISSSLVLTVSGNVWNDADGNLSLNGTETGTNAGGPLYINLVNSSGAVIATTSVNANGTYTVTGVPASSADLRLVLTGTSSLTVPGGLPAGWVNTGENVNSSNSAAQGTILGQIELTTGTSAIIAQNFGIELLPTPGSGSVAANNGGGNKPVTVPASAFTNISASTDTAPGSVTAIRLTAFPSNTTSLTINGSVYTSLPTGGIIIPTTGNGAPTVPILVDPTNDGNSVVLEFIAIDNAGKESVTTGTATLRAVCDLTPIIYARPSTVRNTSSITVVVDVLELRDVATSTPIIVRVSKDDLVNLSFNPSATKVDNRDVQNSTWSFDGTSDPDYYILRTTAVIGASDQLSFGLTGTLTPGATSGTLTMSAVILGGSGGEVRLINNNDADKIDYFQR